VAGDKRRVTEFDAKRLKEQTVSSQASASALVQSRMAELDRHVKRRLRRGLLTEDPRTRMQSEDAAESLRGVPFH
jgi:hypothetical protein